MLRSDEWHGLVGRHLSVRDLCHLMQVSQDHWHLWVADRAWLHHRTRLCTLFPALKGLFEAHEGKNPDEHIAHQSVESNAKKTKKVAWIAPRRGTWWVFKRWLSKGCDMIGFRKILKQPRMNMLLDAIIKCNIPNPDFWMPARVLTERTPKRWFIIDLTEKTHRYRHIQFHVAPTHRLIRAILSYGDSKSVPVPPFYRERHMYDLTVPQAGVEMYPLPDLNPGLLPELLFDAWSFVLYQTYPRTHWGYRWSTTFEHFSHPGIAL